MGRFHGKPLWGTFVFDAMEWYRDTVLYVQDGSCEGEETTLMMNPRPLSALW